MPPRTLIARLAASRNPLICHSCLASIHACPPQWMTTATTSSSSRHLFSTTSPAQNDRLRSIRPRTVRRSPRRRTAEDRSRPTASEHISPHPSKLDAAAAAAEAEGNHNYDVRYFEQDDTGKISELEDEESFNDSFNDMPRFPDLGEFFDTMKEDEEFAPYMGLIKSFQTGVEAHLKDIKDPEEKEKKLQAYLKTLEEKVGSLAETEEQKRDFEEITKELDEIDFLGDFEKSQKGLSTTTSADPPKRKYTDDTPQIPNGPWTLRQQLKVSRLNVVLARRSRLLAKGQQVSPKLLLAAWRAYYHARYPLSQGLEHVPHNVWRILWDLFSTEEVPNANRMDHIAKLSQDMIKAKVVLDPAQQLLSIEALFVTGHVLEALDSWKRSMNQLGKDGSSTYPTFWELGARMFCEIKGMDQAERALAKLVEGGFKGDARILLTFIRTYAEMGTAEGSEQAWKSYRQMRDLLGSSMTIDDYDIVIAYFLATNQTEHGLYAFVDMMSQGAVDLKGREKETLPSGIGNKFFFGKWLKRLIGAGDLEGAYSVVKFMQKRGIEAAPVQVNGLIGAWQRRGGVEDIAKADDVAWQMIWARLGFVEKRRLKQKVPSNVRLFRSAPASTMHLGLSDATDVMNNTPAAASHGLESSLPRATIETFKLMADSYRTRRLADKQAELWDAFQEAEIKADAFMMNKILETALGDSQYSEATELFNDLVYNRGVQPDCHTFHTLWKMLTINSQYIVPPSARPAAIAETRRAFAQLMAFASRAGFQIDESLGRLIVHSFRRLDDRCALAVALPAMHAQLGYAPTDMVALEMKIGTTTLSLEATSQRRRAMLVKRDMDRALSQIAAAMQAQHGTDEPPLQLERRDLLMLYLQQEFWPHESVKVHGEQVLAETEREMGLREHEKDVS